MRTAEAAAPALTPICFSAMERVLNGAAAHAITAAFVPGVIRA